MHTITKPRNEVRRSRSRRTRHALRLAAGAAALATISACGSGPAAPVASTPSPAAATLPAPTTSTVPATTTTAVARPVETIDELVGATGHRMHVRCTGEGDTTVVLIAGFGGDSTGWASVEPAIAGRARVCSTDRPGTGTSDPATGTATFATAASDLHALLDTIGEPGPYVVVGHSFGGAEAVTFASLHPEEVIGVVLVDASPTTWPTTLCSVPDDGTAAAAIVHSTCATFAPSGNGEHLDVVTAFTEASRITSLGNLPMAVITATHRVLPDGLAADEVTRLTNAWNSGQQAWMRLSADAHLVTVDHTGHHIEIDQPGVVIDEITHLIP